MGSIPEPGRSPGGGHRNPLQCSCLEIAMDRGAWWAIAYGVGLQQVRHDWSDSTHVRGAFTYEKWFFKPDCFCRWVRKEQQSLRTLYNTVFKMQNWEGFEPVLKLLSAVLCLVAQSYPTPRDPMDCSPPGSSMGSLQARILEWIAMPSSRKSSQSRDWTQVSHIVGRFFTVWATREAQET